MSQEKLQAFAEAVSKSEELQKQYLSIQVGIAKSSAEKLAKLSESAGTPFTAEEYLNSVAESSEEMSTEQLHRVAGGLSAAEEIYIASSILTAGVTCWVKAIVSASTQGGAEKCVELPGL